MFIKRKIYELDLQNAYEDGNSDATRLWLEELKLQKEYYQDKLIELRESIKTTKKSDLVDKINEILEGKYDNTVTVKCKILFDGKKIWETMIKEKKHED